MKFIMVHEMRDVTGDPLNKANSRLELLNPVHIVSINRVGKSSVIIFNVPDLSNMFVAETLEELQKMLNS